MKTTLIASTLLGTLIAPCSSIINGQNADSGRFPYFASLVDSNDAHRCGGTLIAPDLILTASSCAQTQVDWIRDLRFAHIGYTTASGSTTEIIGIDEFYDHPSWDKSTGAYDLMIVKLQSRSNKQPATVNSDTSIPTSVPATEIDVIGIGQTSVSAPGMASTLKQLPLMYIAQQSCFVLLQVSSVSEAKFKQLPTDHMCLTDYSVNMNGQCFGDDGGPMVEMGETASDDLIVGVMAMNSGTCAAGGVAMYPTKGSRTSLAYEWIASTVCTQSAEPPSTFDCGTVPASGTSVPASSQTVAPVAPTVAPVTPTVAPVAPTVAPLTPTVAPVTPTVAPVTPTVAPVAPTVAPVAPTVAPVAPTVAPVTIGVPAAVGSNPPTSNDVFEVVPSSCLARGASCTDSLECCSGRCIMKQCQTKPFFTRSSLRGPGRGGAAGAAVDVGLGGGGFTVQGFGFDGAP